MLNEKYLCAFEKIEVESFIHSSPNALMHFETELTALFFFPFLESQIAHLQRLHHYSGTIWQQGSNLIETIFCSRDMSPFINVLAPETYTHRQMKP